MKKIASFTVDHLRLNVGLYVSRVDKFDNVILTTYDLRYKKPNVDKVLSTTACHTIEHLGATFLRNHQVVKEDVVYFGPMGCRTGFYLILKGNKNSKEVFELVKEMNEFILEFDGKIPGQDPKDCGNYLDLDLNEAKIASLDYKKRFLLNPSEEQFIYPEN